MPKSNVSMLAVEGAAPSVRLADVIERIQSGSVSKADLESWFVPDYVGEKPFSPGLRLNEAVVDVSGVERTARAAATALGDDAASVIKSAALSKSSSSITAAVSSAGIVAEGDSWFDLPNIFNYPKTAIDVLQKSMPVINLARFGDELSKMIAAGQYVSHLKGGGIRHLLFSAGGNDVLGNIRRHLRVRASTDHDPANAHRYVKPSFKTVLGGVVSNYQTLADQVRTLSPSTVLLVHGYDYALPKAFGAWLGTPLAEFGFDPHREKPLARAIIAFMIDSFNNRLSAFAASNANVRYIDLRGTLGEKDWFGDELHPGNTGAKKIAVALKRAISQSALVG